MKDVTTATRRIGRAEWGRFFEGFSRRHRERPATLEVLGTLGAQTEARELPLAGVSSDPGGSTITFYFGAASGSQLEHSVESPRQLWVELDEGGAEAALAIESESGTKTILAFRSGASGPARR